MNSESRLDGKTYLVVGGGGFLGAQLCPLLVDLGAKVRVYGRTRYYDAPLKGTEWHAGTLYDVQKLASLLDGVEVVFHLAATSSPASAEVNRLADLNTSVGGSLGLLEVCRAVGVNRIVFASSGGTVYGNAERPPYNERTSPSPISTYGINKLAAEHFHRLYNSQHGMSNISLRIANPFGPFQSGLKNQGIVSVFARQILTGDTIRVWGDGSVQRDYIYGRDVAEAMIGAAVYGGSADTLNVGSGIGRSITEVIASLEAALDRRAKVRFLEPRKIDVKASILDCALAERELGWKATTNWPDALSQTCAWIRNAPG